MSFDTSCDVRKNAKIGKNCVPLSDRNMCHTFMFSLWISAKVPRVAALFAKCATIFCQTCPNSVNVLHFRGERCCNPWTSGALWWCSHQSAAHTVG